MTNMQNQQQQESIAELRAMLQPGDTVWTKVESVARPGMSRRISFYVAATEDGKPTILNITWHVARALGEPVRQRGEYVQDAGLWVSGCGMDMCFNTVYNLGRMLFPEGFKVEGRGRNGDMSGWDTDGGYALKAKDL